MDKRKIRVKPRRLNLAVQKEWLKKHWPGRSWISQSALTWLGMLMPSPRSPVYRVKLTYRLQDRPKVTVVSPILEIPEGEKLPHTFPGDELCLYFGDEWNPAL